MWKYTSQATQKPVFIDRLVVLLPDCLCVCDKCSYVDNSMDVVDRNAKWMDWEPSFKPKELNPEDTFQRHFVNGIGPASFSNIIWKVAI